MTTNLTLPAGYKPILCPRETEKAIQLIKEYFQTNLAFELELTRVTAPLFVRSGTGVNDDLNGIEKPVAFAVKGLEGQRVEVVQSLAKWKRLMLADLGFSEGEGLYTDMNAIRPDEVLTNLHSIYVDQWDWERVMKVEDRHVDFLKRIVRQVYDVIRRTEKYIAHCYPAITAILPDEITFIHAEDLAAEYPDLSPLERETEASRRYGAIFLIGIGAPIRGGAPHDGRAPDYDDWITPTGKGRHGLNGDIVVFNPVLDRAFELSSMGIRVSPDTLSEQLALRGLEARRELYFHKRLLAGELPQSIGGGIGQSRLCMLYLRKAHVGEIQSGIWPDEMVEQCRENGIPLL